MAEYDNLNCADIVAEALIDWKVDTIFGLPGDGINGFMEALRTRKDKIKFVYSIQRKMLRKDLS